MPWLRTFSILERIDVGETSGATRLLLRRVQCLSVSSNGSTWVKRLLERDEDVDENLSVSSNGSTWVKQMLELLTITCCKPFSILERIDVGETLAQGNHLCLQDTFQYPRTDRRG